MSARDPSRDTVELSVRAPAEAQPILDRLF